MRAQSGVAEVLSTDWRKQWLGMAQDARVGRRLLGGQELQPTHF